MDTLLLISVAFAIAIWIGAAIYERRENRRKIDNVRRRLRRLEERKAKEARD